MEKFIIYEFQAFLPVRIGQTAGYAFLDTGARSSRILQSYASQLPRTGTTQVRGALAAAQVEECTLEQLSLLGHDFRDVVARIQPDEAAGFQDLPFPVVMTVGADILFQKVLYLECAAGRVGFLQSVPPEMEKRARTMDLLSRGRYAFFGINLGDHQLNAAFDTGSGYCVLNARCAEALQAELTEQQPEETTDSTGARSEIPVYKHPALQVSGLCLGGIRFLVMDLTPVEQALDVTVDFIFGFNGMMNQNWIVDRANQRLLLL